MLEEAVNRSDFLSLEARVLYRIALDLQNFDDVYRAEPAIPDGQVIPQSPLTIEFDRVSFCYPGSDQVVLTNISFKLEPGQKLALVGANGAGKTTAISLLLRQYLPVQGEIRVNGVVTGELQQADYFGLISNLSQEYLLFDHLTIRDNLLIGLPASVDETEIYRVTDLVDASQFIRQLPQQLETRLTPSFEGGVELSAGQRQRLCIARALLAGGDLLILDEPTSAIDALAEQLIFNNIHRHYAHKTTLIVSHRFSTVRQADQIIVLERGRIVEHGNHRELMERAGLYHRMFTAQASGYNWCWARPDLTLISVNAIIDLNLYRRVRPKGSVL